MTRQFILWTPRVLSLLLITLMFMLSFDVFDSNEAWYLILGGFLIHNIPVFVLSIALVISWKKPLVGAVIYIAAGIGYSIFMFIRGGLVMIGAILSLGLPAIIIGILFWLTHHLQILSK